MKNSLWRFKVLVITVVVIGGAIPKQAAAGWMDALTSASQQLQQASQQLEQKSQQMQQQSQNGSSSGGSFAPTPSTNPIKGTWGNQVSCAGPNTATCQNGMDNEINCLHRSQGYYYRLVADNLEGKLKNSGQGLSDQDRKDLEADIAAVKAAIDTNKVVSPDPQNPNRWIQRLTRDDQMQINQLNIKYMNEVHTDCDKRFGGM